jgi:hypothetical protein
MTMPQINRKPLFLIIAGIMILGATSALLVIFDLLKYEIPLRGEGGGGEVEGKGSGSDSGKGGRGDTGDAGGVAYMEEASRYFRAPPAGASYIQTQTLIRPFRNYTARKGYNFVVEGKVLTVNGTPVDGMPVVITVNKTKESKGVVCGEGITINGDYKIECTLPRDMPVDDYHVIAHSLGYYIYNASDSDPSIRVVTLSQIEILSQEYEPVGVPVQIKGRVLEEFGEPIKGEKILLYIEGIRTGEALTDEAGYFNLNYTFNSTGIYKVNAKFLGSRYYAASTASKDINISRIRIEDLTDVLVRGESGAIRGRVVVGKRPLGGVEVGGTIGDNLFLTTTNRMGVFESAYQVPQDTALGKHNLTYHIEQFNFMETVPIHIKARTRLNPIAPKEVKAGETSWVGGVLKDDQGNLINGGKVILVNSSPTPVPFNYIEITQEGLANFSVIIPDEVGEKIFIDLIFEGNERYLPSRASLALPVAKGFPAAYLMVVAIAFLGGGYILYRRGYLSKARKILSNRLTFSGNGHEASLSRPSEPFLEIIFPGIKPPLPDVWGVNEVFEIIVSFRPGGDMGTDDLKIELLRDREKLGEMTSEKDGVARFEYVFDREGEYVMECRVSGDGDDLSSGVERVLRIVDYREEVIKLYNEFLEHMKDRDVVLRDDMTPREALREISKNINETMRGYASIIIEVFEKAEYSTRRIQRDDYVKTYMARHGFLEAL